MATIYEITIESASFSVNPVNINSSTKLTVKVTEKEIIPEAVWYFSGEIYSGEA